MYVCLVAVRALQASELSTIYPISTEFESLFDYMLSELTETIFFIFYIIV